MHRSLELRVAEAEDPTVGADQPVPASVWRASHGDDRRRQAPRSHRAVEPRVTEAEHSAVGGGEPVAAAVGQPSLRPPVRRGAVRPSSRGTARHRS